jgi:hypothetical protein
MPDLTAVALAMLLALAPPKYRSAPQGWAETEDAYHARLRHIAADVASVSRTRMHVAALVGVAVEESGLSPDIDAGYCFVRWGCDGGRAIGIWQLHATSDEQAERFRHNRSAGAAVALKLILSSLKHCKDLPAELRLAGLLGSCRTDAKAARTARRLDASVRAALAVPDPK